MCIIIKREQVYYVLIIRLPKLWVNLIAMLRVASRQVLGARLKTGHCLLGQKCGYIRLLLVIKGF